MDSFVIRWRATTEKKGVFSLNGQDIDGSAAMVVYKIRQLRPLKNGMHCVPKDAQVRDACRMAKATGERIMFGESTGWEGQRVCRR